MDDFEKKPNPTKDQHFMVDSNMLEHICRKANIQPGEKVVEIGGGAGALTEVLAKLGNPITVIELDKYYAESLKEKFKNFDNVRVIEGNALDQTYLEYDRIVANLPYTITEPFLINLAKTGALYYDKKDVKSSHIKSITLVVSQNSARKMVAPIQLTEGGNHRHSNSEFGMISTICKAFLEVDIDCAIPSEAFFPEPAVTSFLVNLTLKSKKTTVDRIMQQILIDRLYRSPSIGKVYNTMLAQGRIYNINKHKGNMIQSTSNFTSKAIINSNVYDLNNMQLSQLIKDLMNNDTNFKSRTANRSSKKIEDSYELYIRTGKYKEEDLDELDDYEEEPDLAATKWKKKAEKTYEYLFNEVRYKALLSRGLENLDPDVLKQRLVNG